MHSTIKIYTLAIALGLMFNPLSAQELPGLATKTDVNGTAYISGGVGDRELEQVNKAVPNFNLKLILAEKSGSYAANVAVAISDAKGKPILNVPSAGPILLTRLAPGRYNIQATYEGRQLLKDVDLHAGVPKSLSLVW